MSIRDIAQSPRYTPLRPVEEEFFTREQVARRWKCSEKGVQRAEKRLGLQPYRFLRAIRYRLSDIVRIETEALQKLPKRFTGLRPAQKAELLGRDRKKSPNKPHRSKNPNCRVVVNVRQSSSSYRIH